MSTSESCARKVGPTCCHARRQDFAGQAPTAAVPRRQNKGIRTTAKHAKPFCLCAGLRTIFCSAQYLSLASSSCRSERSGLQDVRLAPGITTGNPSPEATATLAIAPLPRSSESTDALVPKRLRRRVQSVRESGTGGSIKKIQEKKRVRKEEMPPSRCLWRGTGGRLDRRCLFVGEEVQNTGRFVLRKPSTVSC